MCLLLTGYIGYHTIKGKHGLEARSSLVERAAVLEQEIVALETVRAQLEREVALLNEAAPDPDFVEELARGLLGFARPDERILIARPAQP